MNLKNISIGKKISIMAISCIVIPLVIIIASMHIKSNAMMSVTNSEIREMSASELTNISLGIYETIDQAVNSAIKMDCLSIAKNAAAGVHFFYDQFKSGAISEDDAKKKASAFLLSQKIGKSGYIYVLSGDGKILVHPKTKLLGKDLTQHQFIRDQIALGSSGYFEYMWKNPGEKIEREKCVGQEFFEPWGWLISASGYKKEFALLTKHEIEPALRRIILEKRIGTTGYVYILGGHGEDKGTYILSSGGKRDGENIWDAKDSDGNYFIRLDHR